MLLLLYHLLFVDVIPQSPWCDVVYPIFLSVSLYLSITLCLNTESDGGEEDQSYRINPDRLTPGPVLGREALTGRWYWRMVERKGESRSVLDRPAGSLSLYRVSPGVTEVPQTQPDTPPTPFCSSFTRRTCPWGRGMEGGVLSLSVSVVENKPHRGRGAPLWGSGGQRGAD
ncbi:unnamed protein product [Boreogadus saida]